MQRLCATVHVHKTEVALPAAWPSWAGGVWEPEVEAGAVLATRPAPFYPAPEHTAGIAPCHPPASVSSATCRHSLSVQSSRFAARALGQIDHWNHPIRTRMELGHSNGPQPWAIRPVS